MEKKNLVFLYPISPNLMKLKDIFAEEEDLEIYETESIQEAAQLVEALTPAVWISTDLKKSIILSSQHKAAFKDSRMVLLQKNAIPPKILKKMQQMGLRNIIYEPIPPKSLHYKINLFIKSLPIKGQGEEENYRKEIQGNSSDEKNSDKESQDKSFRFEVSSNIVPEEAKELTRKELAKEGPPPEELKKKSLTSLNGRVVNNTSDSKKNKENFDLDFELEDEKRRAALESALNLPAKEKNGLGVPLDLEDGTTKKKASTQSLDLSSESKLGSSGEDFELKDKKEGVNSAIEEEKKESSESFLPRPEKAELLQNDPQQDNDFNFQDPTLEQEEEEENNPEKKKIPPADEDEEEEAPKAPLEENKILLNEVRPEESIKVEREEEFDPNRRPEHDFESEDESDSIEELDIKNNVEREIKDEITIDEDEKPTLVLESPDPFPERIKKDPIQEIAEMKNPITLDDLPPPKMLEDIVIDTSKPAVEIVDKNYRDGDSFANPDEEKDEEEEHIKKHAFISQESEELKKPLEDEIIRQDEKKAKEIEIDYTPDHTDFVLGEEREEKKKNTRGEDEISNYSNKNKRGEIEINDKNNKEKKEGTEEEDWNFGAKKKNVLEESRNSMKQDSITLSSNKNKQSEESFGLTPKEKSNQKADFSTNFNSSSNKIENSSSESTQRKSQGFLRQESDGSGEMVDETTEDSDTLPRDMQVFVPDLNGLEHTIRARNLISESHLDEKTILEFINTTFTKEKKSTVYYLYYDTNKKTLIDFNKTINHIAQKSGWEDKKKRNLKRWNETRIPTWSDETFQSRRQEFLFPFYEGVNFLGLAVCDIPKKIKKGDTYYFETILETARFIYLKKQLEFNDFDRSYFSMITIDALKIKVLTFFQKILMFIKNLIWKIKRKFTS